MSKIIVTQAKKAQKRVLRIANGMSFEEIQHIIDSMDCNDNRFRSNGSQKIFTAYIQGWRGNDVDNVAPLKPASKISILLGNISTYFSNLKGNT